MGFYPRRAERVQPLYAPAHNSYAKGGHPLHSLSAPALLIQQGVSIYAQDGCLESKRAQAHVAALASRLDSKQSFDIDLHVERGELGLIQLKRLDSKRDLRLNSNRKDWRQERKGEQLMMS